MHRAADQPRARVKLIANLPFSITSELLKLLLPHGDLISHLYLLLEVCSLNPVPGPLEKLSSLLAGLAARP